MDSQKTFSCPNCTTVVGCKRELDVHFNKHHTKPIPEGCEDGYIKVDGISFKVFQLPSNYPGKPVRYRCSLCKTDGNEKEMSIHIRNMHRISQEERTMNRKLCREPLPRTACTICWKEMNEDRYEEHCQTQEHIRKVSYKQGTGCDICRRITFFKSEADKHYASYYHLRQTQHYAPGMGCDICKYPLNPIFDPSKSVNERMCELGLLIENHIQQCHPNLLKLDGTPETKTPLEFGCNICNISFHSAIDSHEETKVHKTIVGRMEKIMMKRQRKKSARF